MPDINFNFSASIFIFIGAIALSYLTNNGWWALAGLSYLLYSKINIFIPRLLALAVSAILFVIAIINMGWSFSF